MKKELRTKIYIFTVTILLLFFVYRMIGVALDNPMNVSSIAEGWTVTYHGQTEENVNLSGYGFKELKSGDEVVIQNTLPDEIIAGAQIRVFTAYATIHVYIAGHDVYSYGHQFAEKDEIIPGVFHRIPLINAYEGRDITIKYEIMDDEPFTVLPNIYIGDAEGIYGRYIQDNLLSLSVGVVLALVGFLLSIVTCVMATKTPSIAIIFHAANFAMMMGLWSLADMYVLNLILNSPEVTYLIKYVTLYLCPTSIVLIFKEINQNRPKWRRIFVGYAVANYLFCIVAFSLYFAKVIHINQSLVYLHLLIGIEIVVAYRSILTRYGFERRKDILLTIGLAAFTGLVILDMFRFNLDLYAAAIGLDLHFTSSFMPFGALIFLVCIFLCYAFDMADQRRAEEERGRLQELAYRDRLTNLYNRQKCDEILQEKVEKGIPYTIINFDLNDLKVMNDSKGHLHGDLLITGFAKILEKVFHQKKSIVGRMGGDEFIAILETTDGSELKKLLKSLEDVMKRESADGEIDYSCAYGVASSTELAADLAPKEKWKTLYEIADQRMYEMKREQKGDEMR